MSTIVAVKKNGHIVIGADTQFDCGSLVISAKYKINHQKIHKFKDSYLGIAGTTANHNVLKSIIKKYQKEIHLNDPEEIFETFLWLQPKLKDEYFVNTNEDQEQEYDSNQLNILIANPYGLFEIQSYREVIEYNHFWSIGSGDEYALGAMYAIYDRLDDPKQIAKAALSAACEFDKNTGQPLLFHTVKLKNAKS